MCSKPSQFHSLANQSGYTFFLVIELLVIIGILSSISLQQMYLVRVQAIREVQRVQAKLLAQSGLVRAEYYLSGGDGHDILWECDAYDEPVPHVGAIHLTNHRFGLLTRVSSQGTNVRATCFMDAIAGRTRPEICKPVLTLAGKVGGLALMPGSRIKGRAVLSHGRICQGKTTREVRDPDLTKENRDSPTLPFDSSQAIDAIERLERDYKEACTLKSVNAGSVILTSENDSIIKGERIIAKGDCRIEKGDYVDKEIYSTGTITLTGEATASLCKLFGKKVIVEGGVSDKSLFFGEEGVKITGGSHNSQFFCTDSIIVSEKPSFGPMTILMMLREGRKDSLSSIRFAPKSRINGTIICCSDIEARTWARSPSVVFGKGIVLNGICMTDGDIAMNDATVRGHLWVRSIVATDGRKAYINYLFDTVLEEPVSALPFPLIGESPVKLIVETVSEEYVHRGKTSVVKDSTERDSTP